MKLTDRQRTTRITEPQLHVLHLLMLDDDPADPGWVKFTPPLNAQTIWSCRAKGLIETSEHGIRLTDAGRTAYVENQ